MNKDEAISFLKNFVHRIDTQYNGCTARPIIIQLRAPRRQFFTSTSDGGWWVHTDYLECDPIEADSSEEAARRYSNLHDCNAIAGDMVELDCFDYEEVLQTFLTHEAYDRHIKLNGHNLPDGYFKYIVHAFRDPELKELFDAIREMVKENP